MRAHDPMISVVIATRDRHELLQRVVRQVLDQLGERDELIVVDDSPSSMRLEAIVGAGVRVVKSGGRGPARARNLGWQAARGEVVAFTDDDVQIDANWLAAIRAEFATRPLLIGVEGRTVTRSFDPLYEYSVQSDRAWNGLTCNVAYRREALDQLDGFDEKFRFAHCEDVDLFLRAKRLGEVHFATSVLVDHEPRAVVPAAFARRGGWLASERRLYAKHRERKPYPLPPGVCAVIGYVRWPVEALFQRGEPSPRRDIHRLRRTVVLSVLWWWNVAKALPSLVTSEP